MPTLTTTENELRITRPWVEINLGVLRDNIHSMQKALRPGASLMFIVKANAYGHGIRPVAECAAKAGVDWFGVAYLHEALEVRAAAPHAQVLIIGVVDPKEVPVLLENNLVAVTVSLQHGKALAEKARAQQGVLPVHLKLDTGMGRLGVLGDEASETLRSLSEEPGLDVQGLCSHFAMVEPGRPAAALKQYELFSAVVASSPKPLFKHLSSSRAFLFHPEWDFDCVRSGIALYGYGTGEEGMRARCKPILQWKTSVSQVKEVPAGMPIGYYGTYVTKQATSIATVAVGYADGYLRSLSSRGQVLIRGRRYAVVGRVSMNWLTIDLGPDTDIVPGDEVVLIGEQGVESIWCNELAALCRTIPHEILTMINPSLPRKYVS